MKVQEFKKLIKEAVREVLEEEYQLPKKQVKDNSLAEKSIVDVNNTVVEGQNPLKDALMSTMKEFTRKDYSNFLINEENFNTSTVSTDSNSGLDLSSLDFVNKAKSVLQKSYELDKRRVT